jgi:hypothetical protein
MTRNRWWTLIAVVALAPLAVRSRAGAPECPKEKCMSRCPQTSSPKLIQKSYPVGGLVQTLSEGPAGSAGTDLLIRAITCAVKPETWSKRGGRGTIDYCPESKALIVNQTAGVHERVEAVLKALAAIQPKQPAGMCPITRAVYNSPSPHLKQYGHFVLDNVKVNAMGVSCTIKRVRFMYKGDGIDADVAKCALTNGESEKKADVPRALTELLETVGKTNKATAPTTLPDGRLGPVTNVEPKSSLPKPVGDSGYSKAWKSLGELESSGKPDKAEAKKDEKTAGTVPCGATGMAGPMIDARSAGTVVGGAAGAVAGTSQAGQPKAEVKKSDETNKTEKGKAKPE